MRFRWASQQWFCVAMGHFVIQFVCPILCKQFIYIYTFICILQYLWFVCHFWPGWKCILVFIRMCVCVWVFCYRYYYIIVNNVHLFSYSCFVYFIHNAFSWATQAGMTFQSPHSTCNYWSNSVQHKILYDFWWISIKSIYILLSVCMSYTYICLFIESIICIHMH